jgi:DNA modification methylase
VYLDPPFNSNQSYSAIFADESGRKSDAQIHAFEDQWHWGPTPEQHLAYLKNSALHQGAVPVGVSQLVAALEFGIGKTPMLAYLVEMAVRLVELHRVLKPTGSLYLHCDPTASHYLKVVLDALFGPKQFRNEIVWKRTSSHNDSVRFGRVHDVILVYARSDETKFNVLRTPLDPSYINKVYRNVDADGRHYRMDNLMAPNGRGPVYEWHGVTRAWRFTQDNMQSLYERGRVRLKADGTANINGFVRYLDENPGQPVQDWWDDIGVIAAPSHERLGYPTQKPLALLERIIEASSNPGDIVLDPFCGCGTATVAAQKLGRCWIGIDVTYLAIGVMRRRLQDAFPGLPAVQVIGQPTEVEGARLMAQEGLEGRYQFQWWALDLIGALPATGEQKKGADTGIDGRITFTGGDGSLQQAIVSVKSGKPKSDDVKVLRGVIEREGAAIGVLVTLDEPTKPMQFEATVAGTYHSDVSDRDYSRIQIISVADLLERGRRPQLPPLVAAPYQKAAKIVVPADQTTLFADAP